jgi:hypothetical protein
MIKCLQSTSDKLRVKIDEFKTFLKVGQTTPDISDVTPFVIEWTPDLLVIEFLTND